MADEVETSEPPSEPPGPAVHDAEAGGAAAEASAPPRDRGGKLLRGATVAPGLVMGVVHRKDHDLASAGSERVSLDQIDSELNRFRKALHDSRLQLVDLKERLHGRVPDEDARILDTHVTYLKDSVFIADVENLILNEQMRLEAAIAKVVNDFDRIFRLVRNDRLRQSAVDLRDVGLRVLRNLERDAAEVRPTDEPPLQDYILIARELSIVDMFNLANEHVRGIATKEGGLTSHAAIFVRSMRIPTITGVEPLLEEVREGDFVILDATEGTLRVNPDELIRAQYAETAAEAEQAGTATEAPGWARSVVRSLDDEEIAVQASCGNLPEVEQAASYGMQGVGLYRTELLFLVDKQLPSRETLVHHYSSVVGAARGAPVTFRLLNVDSGLAIPYLHPDKERNPGLGQVGVRALLAHEDVLRRQLQAILLAGHDADVRIAVPFVSDCGELRRVKEVLFEERLELRKQDEPVQDSIEVGVVIETPTAMLGIRDLAAEADFLLLSLDSLQQYLLAADRDNPKLAEALESLHPFVLRALFKMFDVARSTGRPVWAYGASTRTPENLPFVLGAGLRHFCVPPGDLRALLEAVAKIDTRAAARAARAAARSSCVAETRSLVAGYRHGYARG